MAVRSADFDCQLHHLCIGSDGNARRCHIDLFSFVHFGYVDFLFIMYYFGEHGCSLSTPHRREFASELSAARVQARSGLVFGTTSRDFSSLRIPGTLTFPTSWSSVTCASAPSHRDFVDPRSL